jgi:hypothetical protein
LVEWANQQDGWVRAIVAEVLATRRPLPAASIEVIKDRYLAEKQLSDRDVELVPPLGGDGGDPSVVEPLRLTSLRECTGVNALAEGQEIVFNPRLTILFGENAAGKTGYVRVLKRLANVRSAEEIISDIHRPRSAATPTATVRYTTGDEPHELDWRGEKGVPPFTRMMVFDSPAVALHLEDNVTYLYTPADVALFRHVHEAIDAVRTELEGELGAAQPRQNPFISAFMRNSAIFPKIESLSGSTNLSELEDLARVTDADRAELDALKLSVEALSSTSAGGRSEMLRSRTAILRNLITLGQGVSGFDVQHYERAVAQEDRSRAEQTDAAAAVFGGDQLAAQVRPAWQAFIEAGERYLVAAGHTEYPSAGEICVYCRQALDAAALTLLSAYRRYASGTNAASIEAAATEVAALQAPLHAGEFVGAIEGLRTALPGMEETERPPDWLGDARRLLEGVVALCTDVNARTITDTLELRGLATHLATRIKGALADAETTLQALEGDVKEKSAMLATERDRVTLLEARVTLSALMPEIRSYVERAQWAGRLRTLLGRFQGLLKALTETSKIASQDLLNRDFERVFNEECATLRAPTVTLDFPGRRGQAARRKTVTADHHLVEILSESEQKVIAIADFLAEASLRGGSAPIIFDDPVNSFDHRRIREIARRIASLSGEHQVVVFTHDIWFVSELVSEFEDRPADCTYCQVDARDGLKGVVSRATHPRLDTPTQVKRRINTGIQAAAVAQDDERQSQIDSVYDDVRAWCELVVEVDLLARVTQRHQPNVAMQNLERIKASRLQTAVDIILPIWEKANRYVRAHSQPLSTLGIRPGLDELRSDWAELEGAREAYLEKA